MPFLIICFILFSTLILLGSHPPAIAFFKDLMPDEYQHALVYGALSLLVYMGLSQYKKPVWIGLPVVAVMGALDEWHQSFVPGRNPDLGDWGVDVAAAFVVVSVFYVIRYSFLALRQTRSRYLNSSSK